MENPVEQSREEAFKVIEELREKYRDFSEKLHDMNEANTRLLLIDTVLVALGWSKDDFNPEERAGKIGYIDYLLSIDGIPRLVVEAKRSGHTFGSRRTKSTRTNYQLRHFRSSYGSTFRDVLEQAEKYTLECDVPFALLSNGAEWILVQLRLIPGFNSKEDLQGVYFGNLFSDGFEFNLLWDLLYKPFVTDGTLDNYFADLNTNEVEYSRIPYSQFGELGWKSISNNLTIKNFYDRFFGEITDIKRRNMLEKCFVTNTELDQYQGELNRALKDTAPTYIQEAIDISPDEHEKLIPTESGDKKGRVVIIAGSVGCGKSTLVAKVFLKARQENRGKVFVLLIDLIDEITDESDNEFEAKLWKHLNKEWKKTKSDTYNYEFLQKIFGKELSDLKQGAYSKLFKLNPSEYVHHEANLLEKLSADPDIFFQRCWHYYRQKGIGVAVIFDNVDKASESSQKKVYNFAHRLSQNTGSTAIITMRETTFFRGREGGFLDVRSSDVVFHLRTPNLEQILSKRIGYVHYYLNEDNSEVQKEDQRISKWKKSEDWNSFKEEAVRHADMLKRTFLISKPGRDSQELLAAISWHDVRYFLNTLQRLHFMLGSANNAWNHSEIVAALMTPSDVGSNVIGNIFRPSFQNYRCYFLKARILLMLIYGLQPYESRRGVPLTRILRFGRYYGYQERWTRKAITEMVQERFLECIEAPAAEEYAKNYKLIETHSFRQSPLGVVVINKLISEPVYLGIIGNNIPFYKQTTYKNYEETLKTFIEALDQNKLERAAIGLLAETNLGYIVARYIVDAFNEEPPATNLLNHVPEVAKTEEKLLEILEKLRIYANLPSPTKKVSIPSVLQYPLFSDPMPIVTQIKGTEMNSKLSIPIPEGINKLKIERSSHGPLILWALVFLRKNGQLFARGFEITQVINDNLVDDDHKVEKNNISRALRYKTLKSQKWLITKKIKPRETYFGLAQDWATHWLEIFGDLAPEIE